MIVMKLGADKIIDNFDAKLADKVKELTRERSLVNVSSSKGDCTRI